MFDELISMIALALREGGVPYMVIGGQAVLLYGQVRFTRDIDVTLALAPPGALAGMKDPVNEP